MNKFMSPFSIGK